MPDSHLSFGQHALWMLQRLAPTSTAYNVALAFDAGPELDPELLRQSFESLHARHGVLRTTFPARDGQPERQLEDAAALDFTLDSKPRDAVSLERHLAAEAARPFDLERDPVLRVRVLRRAQEGARESGWSFLLVVHHIAIDFYSVAVLLDELGTAYGALAAGATPKLPQLEASYGEFVAWERELVDGQRGATLESFWRERLAGAPAQLVLPFAASRPARQSFAGGCVEKVLSAPLPERLEELAEAVGGTLDDALLAAFAALLHRAGGQSEVVVGLPVSGRPGPAWHEVIGYFVNTAVCRLAVDPAAPFRDLLAQVAERRCEAVEHAAYPFPLLVEKLQPDRPPGVSPFYQVLFALYRGDGSGDVRAGRVSRLLAGASAGRLALGGLELVPRSLPGRVAMLDLSLLSTASGGEVSASLQHATDLVRAPEAERLLAGWGVALAAAAENPETPVKSLPAPFSNRTQVHHEAPDMARDRGRERAEQRRARMGRRRPRG